MPGQLEDSGLEAHLERVRRGEVPARRVVHDRPDADRPNLGAGLDPLSGFFGGSSAKPASDPYENTRTVHIDPERDL